MSAPLPGGRGRRPFRLAVEGLEDRAVPAAVVAVGADAGGGPRVTVFDRATGAVVRDFMAYEPTFTGGVRVAVADFNADGTGDVLVAPGPGRAPEVKVFDGKTGGVLRTISAFEEGFLGGVEVAAADATGDGTPDLAVAAGPGGGPRVRLLDGRTGAAVRDFFAFEPAFRGGARVAAGDLTGDRKAELVAAAGPGGGPAVRAFDAVTGDLVTSFFAYEPGFTGGVFVSAADVTGDGTAELVTGPGAGGGPAVRVFDALTGAVRSSFFAYAPTFAGGVRVSAFAPEAFGPAVIATAPGSGLAADVRLFSAAGTTAGAALSGLAGFTGGATVGGFNFAALVGGELTSPPPAVPPAAVPPVTTPPAETGGPVLVTLQLDALDVNLLGLQLTTSPITVTVSVEAGGGKLLGNLLTVVSNLVNLDGVNTALNNVLDSVVGLVNQAALTIDTAVNPGPLDATALASTPVLDLFVAPVHLDLLGAKVDTSPITVSLRANTGSGLILGNVVAELAHLFDPPLPDRLDLGDIADRLDRLLAQLDRQLPGVPPAASDPVSITSNSQVLRLVVPAIDLNLLGLNLQTDQIRVNADAQVGSGELLGNVLTTLLNTLDATPADRERLSNSLNALLARVVGVLNATELVLPAGVVAGLSQVLQTLALPDLVTAEPGATAPVLDLVIASPDGDTPPVDVDLLGLKVTTSNITARLTATTGEGQVLGNLVYNVAHLLDPGGSLNLLGVLAQLGL